MMEAAMNRFMEATQELSVMGLEQETWCRLAWLVIALFLTVSLFSMPASAQTDNWLGGTGNWSDPSKWSAGVPTATSNVFIDNGNGQASVVTVDGGFQCNNLTIDADDTLTIQGGAALVINGSAIANRGKINVTTAFSGGNAPAALTIAAGKSVQLAGLGVVTLIDVAHQAAALINGGAGATLTNANNLIQGSGQIGQAGGLALVNQSAGVINANQSGFGLLLDMPAGGANQGLIEATGGGSLMFSQGITVNNAGGTITASGAGSVVLLEDVTQGGTLTTSGGGLIQAQAATLDGVTHGTLNNQGTFALVSGDLNTVLIGTINNTGTFVLDDTNGPTGFHIADGQNVTLTGGGTISLNDVTQQIAALISGGPGSTLTNVNNLIQGSGQIGQAGGLILVNQKKGVINANQAGHSLFIDPNGGATNQGLIESTKGSTLIFTTPVSNSGTFTVAKKSLFQITNTFTNFSGTTLTGGTYKVSGTLQFLAANITTNAANITLTGAASAILDLNKNDALRSLSSTTNKGSLSLTSGRNLTTPGAYTNAGKLIAGKGTKFTATNSYTQTAGTTTADGTVIASSGATIQAGKVFGKGTIASTMTSSGSVTAGDSPAKPGILSPSTYTQNSNGSLNIPISGTTLGTQYGQLAVANGASLNGTLNISLINNFVPAIGDTFTVLTASAVTGTFATVNGLSINGSEHFAITYNPTNVTLTVESGP
jgi:hypothetical protein